MRFGARLAFLQLLKEKKRLAAAATGILFAVALMLIQLGFQDALMASAGLHAQALDCDLMLATPLYQYLLQPGSFPKRRLYQAAADPRVDSVAPLYLSGLPWKNPITRELRLLLVIGAPPMHGVFSLPAIDSNIDKLRDPEQALFDEKARTEFGPVAETVRAGRPVATEIANRRVVVTGLFAIGTTFGVDATAVVSDDAFQRMQPNRDPGTIMLGLIRLKPGFASDAVAADLERELPNDVYYGVQTLRALENFPISGIPLKQFDHFITALAYVKKAAAQANCELGVLAKDRADAIAGACDEIAAGSTLAVTLTANTWSAFVSLL